MDTFKELRDWVLRHRNSGSVGAVYRSVGPNLGTVGFKIYEPKLPGDEVQFIADYWDREKGKGEQLKFEEHPDTHSFWVFPLLKEGEPPHEHIHEVFKLSEPLENLEKAFNGRYNHLVDILSLTKESKSHR